MPSTLSRLVLRADPASAAAAVPSGAAGPQLIAAHNKLEDDRKSLGNDPAADQKVAAYAKALATKESVEGGIDHQKAILQAKANDERTGFS